MDCLPQAPAYRRGRAAQAGWRLGKRVPFGRPLLADEAGQGLVEYSLVILLIVLVAIPALEIIGVSVTSFLSDAASQV